jgi:hypothetical protein
MITKREMGGDGGWIWGREDRKGGRGRGGAEY